MAVFAPMPSARDRIATVANKRAPAQHSQRVSKTGEKIVHPMITSEARFRYT